MYFWNAPRNANGWPNSVATLGARPRGCEWQRDGIGARTWQRLNWRRRRTSTKQVDTENARPVGPIISNNRRQYISASWPVVCGCSSTGFRVTADGETYEVTTCAIRLGLGAERPKKTPRFAQTMAVIGATRTIRELRVSRSRWLPYRQVLSRPSQPTDEHR
jgi:hypothetical protein